MTGVGSVVHAVRHVRRTAQVGNVVRTGAGDRAVPVHLARHAVCPDAVAATHTTRNGVWEAMFIGTTVAVTGKT